MTREVLLGQIRTRQAVVAIIGLGYAGLPLAVAFAQAGFRVIGVDVNAAHVADINNGISHTSDIPNATLASLVTDNRLHAVTEYTYIREADASIICVPTPLRKSQDPDISYVVQAAEGVTDNLKPNSLVVLQSTTYPGTTTEILLPALGTQGKVGQDFYLAYSPERIDPGNTHYNIRNTPRVVGGVTPACQEIASKLFETVVEDVVLVENTTTAETVKLLENTFRAVNIALVNETALVCQRLGIDVWDVITAASTKPFGFLPFYPGPGIGGHCIPVDPHYLSWKLRTLDYETQFIRLASEINASMPRHVVSLVADALNEVAKPMRGSRILVIGVAYKRDIGDVRESPSLSILVDLQSRGANLVYHDPYVPQVILENGVSLDSLPELKPDELDAADLVLILTDHSLYDWNMIVQHASVVVDTRNVTSTVDEAAFGRIVKL